MARRGLVSDEHLPALLGWLSKVRNRLYFPVFPRTINLPSGHLFRHPQGFSLRWIKCAGRRILRTLVTREGARSEDLGSLCLRFGETVGNRRPIRS